MSFKIRFILVLVGLSQFGVNGLLMSQSRIKELDEKFKSLKTTSPRSYRQQMQPTVEPTFDMSEVDTNVTAMVGKSAFLVCKVDNLGHKMVSWIRHRDIHILSVGGYTYASDQRFQALHRVDSTEFTMQIKFIQKRDIGMYECQISTKPIRSMFYHLDVVVPRSVILGGPNMHVNERSLINLTCVVDESPEPPLYVFWYHNNQVISYDSPRGGVSVIIEKDRITSSTLLLKNAKLSDAGKYKCNPSNANSADIELHVIKVESQGSYNNDGTALQAFTKYASLLIVLMIFD